MKTLLALITCHSRGAYADAQRDTWIPNIPPEMDYKFFLGLSTREPKSDEVFLDCDDSYNGLPSKVRAIAKWALEHDYDFMVKIDDDTIVKPVAFLKSGYQHHDFTGRINNDHRAIDTPWGFFYILSKRAMEIMASSALPGNNNDEMWISHTLKQHGIVLHREYRYYLHRGQRNDFIPKKPRPLRGIPHRTVPMDEETKHDGIAYCIFLNWQGYHATPDEVNIKEYYKLYKELTQ